MTYMMILEHLFLVIASLFFAIAVGVPLGVLTYLYPTARKVILRVVDLIQTTPALALLGIIMVFMGAGKPTVILGLALYSLLPIVRNTDLGLSQVPDYLTEAATGMGMGRLQQLFRVELPLALPILFTGIRIATVNSIGTAVFAAFVGGGGIGSIINTGIRRMDMKMILAGTGALMVMALVLDGLMALTERSLNKRGSPSGKTRRPLKIAAAVAAAAMAVFVLVSVPRANPQEIVMYDGQFSEVKLINRMVQQLVEDRTDLTVSIKDEMTSVNNFSELTGSTPSCDLMYSWDGTLLTTFFHLDTGDIPDGQSLYDFVNDTAQEQYGVHMLGKTGIDNTYAIGVTQNVIDTYGVKTVSDLVPIADQLLFGAEQDFYTDAGSMKYQPFVDFYGLKFKKSIQVDIMLKYNAIEQGSFDVMIVYATDGLNKRANLTVLEDDLSFFPEYNGVLLVRDDTFDKFRDAAPNLEEVLELLSGKFTNEMMTDLTYRVDVLGENVDVVARDFLVTQGLLAE